MDWNVFVDAKFGDVFVTRDNRKIVYFASCHYDGKEGCIPMHKVSDGWSIYLVRDDGISKLSGEIGDNDVISRYHEPIDEEKLNVFAENYLVEYHSDDKVISTDDITDAYEAGYRKAMEE